MVVAVVNHLVEDAVETLVVCAVVILVAVVVIDPNVMIAHREKVDVLLLVVLAGVMVQLTHVFHVKDHNNVEHMVHVVLVAEHVVVVVVEISAKIIHQPNLD